MATAKSIICTYEHEDISFDVPFKSDGFFNATAAAKQFGKRPNDWLILDATKEYIVAITRNLVIEQNQLVIVKKGAPENGGGTWLHPKLATMFARWLDANFAVWADMQIDAIMRGDAVLISGKSYENAYKVFDYTERLCKRMGTDKAMAIAIGVEHVRRVTGIDFKGLLKATNTTVDVPLNLGDLGSNIGVSSRRMGAILTEQGLRFKDIDGEYKPTEKGKPYCTYNPYQSEFSDHTGYQALWYPGVLNELTMPKEAAA